MLMSPVNACQCLQDLISLADTGGGLYTVSVVKDKSRYTHSILGQQSSRGSSKSVVVVYPLP